MIKELPPAKHAEDYSPAERRRITKEAAEAAVLLAQHMQRLVELEEEMKNRGG